MLLADDQALIRAGLRALLETAEDIEVVAEAANGVEAVDLALRYRPDVVLLDIRMPEMDGLAATRSISARAELNTTKVIILTTYEVEECVYDALRAGASGFLLKDTEPSELLQGVRVVHRGDALLAPSVTRRVIADIAGQPRPASNQLLSALTRREREVLTLIAVGLANNEIASRLYLSPLTIKTHVSRMLSKLRARDRAQLVVIAYETGLVRPGHSVSVAQ